MEKNGLGQFREDKAAEKTGSKELKLEDNSKIEPKLTQSGIAKDKNARKKGSSNTADER